MTVRLAFGYLAVNPQPARGRDPLADRPRIPAPPPGAGDPATDIEGSPPFRTVTIAPIPGLLRVAAAAVGVAVLYAMLLAGTSYRLEQALDERAAPRLAGHVASRVLWMEAQPEAVAAKAGSELASQAIGNKL